MATGIKGTVTRIPAKKATNVNMSLSGTLAERLKKGFTTTANNIAKSINSGSTATGASSATTVDPITQRYTDQYNQYAALERAKANQQIAANNATALANQQNAYRNSVRNLTALNENLKRRGITGGATETTRLANANNLANVQAAYQNAATGANTNINNSLAQTLAAYKLSNDQNLQAALDAEKARQLELENVKYNRQVNKQNAIEQRYANTIARYDTVAKVDAAIKAVRKSGKNLWRIQYLQAQRAALRNAAQA